MSLEQDVQRIIQDVQEVRQDVKQLLVQSAENKVTLSEHMRRTELNEDRIKKLEYWILGFLGAGLLAVLKILVS